MLSLSNIKLYSKIKHNYNFNNFNKNKTPKMGVYEEVKAVFKLLVYKIVII
jgi:hypothetical protein